MHRASLHGSWAVAALCAIAAIAVAAPAPSAVTPQRADSLFQRQDWAAAHDAYAALTQAEPGNGRFWYRLGYTEYQAKDYAHAVEAWMKSESIGHNPVVMYNLAGGYAMLGNKDQAFAWLDKAAASGFGQEAQLAGDGDLASLHDDPRWKQSVAAVHAAAAPCESKPEWHQFDFWTATGRSGRTAAAPSWGTAASSRSSASA